MDLGRKLGCGGALSALRREAVRICAALEPGTDLRARARCGDKRGAWQTVMEGEEPLCAKRGASGGR